MAFFQKPENALKRAKELMHIPNVEAAVLKRSKRAALEILHDALVAKKHRTWQPVHEDLMTLYLDICMELQLGRIAKDGLHQYRNLSIATNPASLENIIQYFVAQTEAKLALAKKESNELIIQQAASVDLEAAQTPEAVMLSTTSFDSSSDRTDREVVVPWLRFTWETYRTVLDILKNNSKLEGLYKNVTLKAFDFCVEYTRKIEFRRLCEILRNHLGALQKHTAAPTSQSARQMRAWDGFTLDTVEKLLEVRYRQLQVASQLELFSEAFRTIDDINTIMNLVDQVPRLDLMVTYYERLAQIFLVSKNFLFHAYALYKFYALRVAGLNGMDGGHALKALPSQVSADEQRELATRVVLAALSVPLLDFEASTELTDDSESATQSSLSSAAREKSARMAALLGYATTPTRAQLLDEIEVAGVLAKASPEVAVLFQHIERDEVDPLQIVAQVTPSLEKVRASPASSYVDAIERLVVRRVLFQLTRVYSSVTIAHLKSLLVGLNVSYQEIEQLIVRSRSLSTVAHASAPSLTSLYLKNSSGVESSTAAATATALRTKIRIDHVQQCIRFSEAVELEANPAQLTLLGERLQRVLSKVNHAKIAESEKVQRTSLFTATRASLASSRAQLVERREIIERRKEELERLQQEKIKSLEKKRQEYEQMRQQLEKERLEAEAKRREAEKKQKIKDEIALKETKQMLDKLGRKDLDNIDLEKIDREALINEAKEKAQKAKEEAQRKLKDSARRLDYIIRATREAEQPIIQKLVTEEKETAKVKYEQEKAEKLKLAKEEHEFALKEKVRLQAALPVATAFIAAHRARRAELFRKTAEEQQKKAALARLEKRVAHAKERYEDEQVRIREEEEEQERRRREEEAERERARQAEIDAEIRRQEEEEEERRREEEKAAREEAEAEQRRESARDAPSSRFGSLRDREGGAYRPPTRRSDAEEGDWKSVGRDGPRSSAPEGRWERAGPPARGGDDRFGSRFGDRDGGDRFGSRFGDRDGGDRFGSRFSDREPRDDRFSSRFGDREPREGGLRRGFGGDRDSEPREGGLRRAFGGDRDSEPREGGLRRAFGGDRDSEPREGGLRRAFGGDREPREGGLRGAFGGDREPREGGLRRAFGGDREGGDREGGGLRRTFGDRDGSDRFGSRREGDREGGAYRPPRGDREQTRAPESGRWR